MSMLDEWTVFSPVNVPNRLSATIIDQRWAAQNGQYSAPTYSTSGLPPEVSGVSVIFEKYAEPAALAAGISLLGMNTELLMLPPPTLSRTLCGTVVTFLVRVLSAAPVGPLLADDPPLFIFTSTNATTTTTTARMDPPAR